MNLNYLIDKKFDAQWIKSMYRGYNFAMWWIAGTWIATAIIFGLMIFGINPDYGIIVVIIAVTLAIYFIVLSAISAVFASYFLIVQEIKIGYRKRAYMNLFLAILTCGIYPFVIAIKRKSLIKKYFATLEIDLKTTEKFKGPRDITLFSDAELEYAKKVTPKIKWFGIITIGLIINWLLNLIAPELSALSNIILIVVWVSYYFVLYFVFIWFSYKNSVALIIFYGIISFFTLGIYPILKSKKYYDEVTQEIARRKTI